MCVYLEIPPAHKHRVYIQGATAQKSGSLASHRSAMQALLSGLIRKQHPALYAAFRWRLTLMAIRHFAAAAVTTTDVLVYGSVHQVWLLVLMQQHM